MRKWTWDLGGMSLPVTCVRTVVVGSGAAGFNAADCLYENGQRDFLLLTDHVKAGTSRNTGSDKQTYYKLSLCGDDPDSVRLLAKTLFEGQCVDGDIALCEAACSTKCFCKLASLGVPFPQNGYGEYVGYKTDHDPYRRATSVGPYTSRQMTERLEKAVLDKGITVLDHQQVIRILTDPDKKRVRGLLCLNTDPSAPEDAPPYAVYECENVIYATGGPAGMYADSVYPYGQYGASGLAYEAGVTGKNLTEWQYGIASVHPRWNVSGTYMQVLPRFVSTKEDGSDPREFLYEYFDDPYQMLSLVFLKGYQWPFDVRKLQGGSSLIDVCVYQETCVKKRRVFLDFRSNTKDMELDFVRLSEEAYTYLQQAGACLGTPIVRLRQMNEPAYQFYLDKGVDLSQEMLEIALCAQHNNGGLGSDSWWQTNVKGFFAAGEACGTHGVYRPGGTALNAGQVGSLRAAEYIAHQEPEEPDDASFRTQTGAQAEAMISFARDLASRGEDGLSLELMWKKAQRRMSEAGAAFRDTQKIAQAVLDVREDITRLSEKAGCTAKGLSSAFRLRDMLLCQLVYLSAMENYQEHGGKSRGSALYLEKEGALKVPFFPYQYSLDEGALSGLVQETSWDGQQCHFVWRDVRPIPPADDFFENVWKKYREGAYYQGDN